MMVSLELSGRNRFVILTRNYAIKIPSLRCWRDFLFGLLNNQHEAAVGRNHPDLCPVLFAVPGGFLIVMPRLQILSDAEFDATDIPSVRGAERKASSWGWLDSRPVAVDYGWE